MENEDDYSEDGLFRDFFIVHMIESTCQRNNRGLEKFGYPGKPTIDATLLLEDFSAKYGVFIGVIVQPTHRLKEAVFATKSDPEMEESSNVSDHDIECARNRLNSCR